MGVGWVSWLGYKVCCCGVYLNVYSLFVAVVGGTTGNIRFVVICSKL